MDTEELEQAEAAQRLSQDADGVPRGGTYVLKSVREDIRAVLRALKDAQHEAASNRHAAEQLHAIAPCGHWSANAVSSDAGKICCLACRVDELEQELDEVRSGCRCQACGENYREDVMLPDEMWDEIRPHGKPPGGGLLCGRCTGLLMFGRLKLAQDHFVKLQIAVNGADARIETERNRADMAEHDMHEAESENELLRVALRRYGHHDGQLPIHAPACRLLSSEEHAAGAFPCSCGLDAALGLSGCRGWSEPEEGMSLPAPAQEAMEPAEQPCQICGRPESTASAAIHHGVYGHDYEPAKPTAACVVPLVEHPAVPPCGEPTHGPEYRYCNAHEESAHDEAELSDLDEHLDD